VPLRLLGALHYLALSGRAPALAEAYAGDGDPWPPFREALAAEQAFVESFLREQSVQTNEVQRCYGLLPAFLTLARETGLPLDLLELGPSAGLNLLWDRYRYRFGSAAWGPAGSPVELDGELRGLLPPGLLDVVPDVRRRRGIDLNPIDVTGEEGALLLQCFVWPDVPGRLERLRRAIEVLRTGPPELIAGDYVELLPEVLAQRDPEALTVVFESASFVYLDTEQLSRIDAALREAAPRGPLALVTLMPAEEAGALRLRRWPGGEERTLADMHAHGAWLQWLEA
jgi:hypothetical protein